MIEETVTALAAVAVFLVVVVALFALRKLTLARERGSFDCSWRPDEGRWTLGVARFTEDAVEWWRVFSLVPRPREVWQRQELEVLTRREPSPGEVDRLLAGVLVVSCVEGGRPVELAMSAEAYTGFASWLEGGAPRGRGRVT